MSTPAQLSENVLIETRATRNWIGVRVELTNYACTGRVLQRLHDNDTCLGVILEEVGRSPVEPRLEENTPCPIEHRPRNMHFTSAGMELWGYRADVRFVKYVPTMAPASRRLLAARGSASDEQRSCDSLLKIQPRLAWASRDRGDGTFPHGFITTRPSGLAVSA
jgi:hypothetical protein